MRRATPSDLSALVALSLKAVELFSTDEVVSSKDRIEATAKRLISDPQSFVLVTGKPIDGAIVIAVNDAVWFERKVACILLWYAQVPGTGRVMLRKALEWFDSRPAIKGIGFAEDFGGDRRTALLLERKGLKLRGSVFARFK